MKCSFINNLAIPVTFRSSDQTCIFDSSKCQFDWLDVLAYIRHCMYILYSLYSISVDEAHTEGPCTFGHIWGNSD